MKLGTGGSIIFYWAWFNCTEDPSNGLCASRSLIIFLLPSTWLAFSYLSSLLSSWLFSLSFNPSPSDSDLLTGLLTIDLWTLGSTLSEWWTSEELPINLLSLLCFLVFDLMRWEDRLLLILLYCWFRPSLTEFCTLLRLEIWELSSLLFCWFWSITESLIDYCSSCDSLSSYSSLDPLDESEEDPSEFSEEFPEFELWSCSSEDEDCLDCSGCSSSQSLWLGATLGPWIEEPESDTPSYDYDLLESSWRFSWTFLMLWENNFLLNWLFFHDFALGFICLSCLISFIWLSFPLSIIIWDWFNVSIC